jgi:YD repeat-containing protein
LDDFAVYVLSTALAYDAEGRPKSVRGQDRTQVTQSRDRFGKVDTITDAKGWVTGLSYDPLNRIVAVTDPLGNITGFRWDPVGNLSQVADPLGNATRYKFDTLNRLSRITYMDGSTELFTYDAASNLATYTNNRGQSRTLSYDAENRLVQVLYNTDSTSVFLSYDAVGNVLSRTERNGDVSRFSYDPLYRLVGVERDPASGSPTLVSKQQNTYDAVSNRTAFACSTGGGQIDVGTFDVSAFAGPEPMWTAPYGYDVMNRLPYYQDRLGNQTRMDS